MPLHYVQHNYCGPFTTDYSAEAVSELDECCRTHDLQYENPYIHTRSADSQLVDCLQQTGTTSGQLIGGIIQIKQAIDLATNYASDVMLRPGNKRRHELEQQNAADKRAKADKQSTSGGNIDNNNNDNQDNAGMADVQMGEPAVGPSDVISGTISGGDITATGGDTAGIQTVHFTRTFVHYITNTNATWSTFDYKVGQLTGPGVLTMKHNCVEIPYPYLNCSMTKAEMETHIVPSTSWRVVSAGFKVTNMIPIIDAIQGGGDAAQMVYQISTRPYLVAYTDTKYNYFTHNARLQKKLPNHNVTINTPRTRQDGYLQPVVDTKFVDKRWFNKATGLNQMANHENQDMEILQSYWNTNAMKALYAGDTYSYQWNNKDPYFFNNKSFSWKGNTFIEGPILVWDKLLPVCIPGDYMNQWVPDPSGFWSTRPSPNVDPLSHHDTHKKPTPGRSILTQMPNYPANPPPIAALEVPSLLTATNLAGTITYQVTVIYNSTIQVELISGNPQFAGWSFNFKDTDQTESNTQLCQGPVGLKNYVYNRLQGGTNDCVTR